MRTTSASSLCYDVTETLDAFRRRQQRAYQAGQTAWHENRIPLRLLPLYERLIRYVGANAFTFVEVATLASEFRVHLATMKRWLAALEDAALIRRQRQFARSSRTFITAYDTEADPEPFYANAADDADAGIPSVAADITALESTTAGDTALRLSTPAVDDPRIDVPHSGIADMHLVRDDRAADAAIVLPAPPIVGRIPALSLGAFLRSDHLKNYHLTGGGGQYSAARGPSPIRGLIPDTPAVAALRAIGTHDPGCLRELASRPPAEIRAACAWARRVSHPDDLGALAVHFARQLRDGLLACPSPTPDQPPASCATPRTGRARRDANSPIVCVQCHARVVGTSGACCSACAGSPTLAYADPAAPRAATVAPPGTAGVGPPRDSSLDGGAGRMAIWQQVCATLRASTTGTDLALWLEDSELLDVTDTTAVVGTSNVFVRDALQTHVSQLAGALGGALEQAVDVLVVVDRAR